MIEKEIAIKIKALALNAVESLHDAVTIAHNECSQEDFDKIRRGVGLSIGRIQMDLLEEIYTQYPELDHLTES